MSGGGGKLRSHGGERSNRGAEDKVERFPHKDRCQPALTSLSLLTLRGDWELGAGTRASEVRSQGEDWVWLHEHSLKGANALCHS